MHVPRNKRLMATTVLFLNVPVFVGLGVMVGEALGGRRSAGSPPDEH